MPEAKSRHVDYRPDEYISGVAAKLTAEEQGVYWMICSLIMSHGGPIDYDAQHIGRLVCLSRAKANNVIKKLIKIGKITENGSLLGQKRAEKEVKSALKRIEKSQINGAKGGRPRKENKDLEKPTGLSGEKLTTNTPTHQPPTHIVEGDKSPTPKRKTGKRISDDWELDIKDVDHAKSKGYDNGQINALAEQFHNHWLQATGKGSTSLDWCRKWITWVGKDIEWNGKPGNKRNTNTPGNGRSNPDIFEAVAKAVESSELRQGQQPNYDDSYSAHAERLEAESHNGTGEVIDHDEFT